MSRLTTLERFRAVVARRLGLHFDETRLGELADLLERLGGPNEGGPEAYVARLEHARASREDVRVLASHLTVGETYFLRHADQYRALVDVALRERQAARGDVRRLKVLSAGCSSGEEVYSLALVLRERVTPEWEVSILGVDVNPASLARAANGRYSGWSLRETPEDTRRRWFRLAGRDYEVDPTLRAAVRFEERNLAEEEPDLWLDGWYDAVFCRNVLMYFTPDAARAAIARIARSLVPGGYLFLGHAENLRGLSQDFHLLHTHNTFYYERKGDEANHRPHAGGEDAARHPVVSTGEPDPVPDTAWIETVRRAAERIEELSVRPNDALSADPRGLERSSAGGSVSRAIELLERERFGEALELLGKLPDDSARDPDVLLLRAVLLTHSGQLGEAEGVCAQLRGLDELSAGAHYLLALCREGAGDRRSAVENDQVAAYLDPSFAMPRLHLGLLARRAGDLQTAQRELEQALALLAREDASRILLYGGGFTREALTHLCRAELRAAGGNP